MGFAHLCIEPSLNVSGKKCLFQLDLRYLLAPPDRRSVSPLRNGSRTCLHRSPAEPRRRRWPRAVVRLCHSPAGGHQGPVEADMCISSAGRCRQTCCYATVSGWCRLELMCPESTAGHPSSFVAPQPSGPWATFRPRQRCPVPPLWPRPRARADAEVVEVPRQSVARLGCLGRGRGFRRAQCKGLDDLGPGPSRTWPSRPAPLTPTWPSRAHP